MKPYSKVPLCHKPRAQSMVEFALTLPLLLLILFGLMEVGRLIGFYVAVSSASREAARYGSASGDMDPTYLARYKDCDGMRAAAQRVGVLGDISAANISITYDSGPGTAVIASSCPPGDNITMGDRVVIQVTSQWTPLVPLVPLQPVTLSSVTSRTILKNVDIHGTPPPASQPNVYLGKVEEECFEGTAGDPDKPACQFVVPVVLSHPWVQPITVTFARGGTATPGVDYTITGSPLVIGANTLGGNIIISVVPDALYEDDETVIITLISVEGGTLLEPKVFTGHIKNDDPKPIARFTSRTQSVPESIGSMSAYVQLVNDLGQPAPSGKPTTVRARVIGGTATGGGVDYTLMNWTVYIPPGSTIGGVNLHIIDDFLHEENETIELEIYEAIDAELDSDPEKLLHTITIVDNDEPPVVVFSPRIQTLSRTAGIATVTVALNKVSGAETTIHFTSGGTAEAGTDYTNLTSSPITIPAGELTRHITFNIRNIISTDKTVVLTMGTVVNATKGFPSTHTTTITGNAVIPSVFFESSAQSVMESGGRVKIHFRLSQASNLNVTIPFTLSGTATLGPGANADYTLLTPSPITIPAGQTTGIIEVQIIDDDFYEVTETIIIQFGAPTNATLGDPSQHIVSIIDNDPIPSIYFVTDASSFDEDAGEVTVEVRLSAASGINVSAPFSISADSTAMLGDDYTVITTSPLIFTPGETSKLISINIIDDAQYEVDEKVMIVLGTPTNAKLIEPSVHTLWIIDNDVPVCSEVYTMTKPEIFKQEKKISTKIRNKTTTSVHITSIALNWTHSQLPLTQILLQNTLIWNSNPTALLPSTTISSSLFVQGADATIPDGVEKELVFIFDTKSNRSLLGLSMLQITLNNGCTLSPPK
jgi:Flp pilus assembly protein TadG